MNKFYLLISLIIFFSCSKENAIVPDYTLTADQKHNKFSKLIPPVLTVKSGAIIKADANEASDNQLHRKATLDDLIFPIPRLISYISEFTALSSGDVIVTGTPGGVGDKRNPPVYMVPGDIVEVDIGLLGVLKNPVIAEPKL